MDGNRPWNQVNVSFPSWDQAENTAAACIGPQLETDQSVTAWWFIRKSPCWRIRYQLADPGAKSGVEPYLDELATAGRIAGWTRAIYEPEDCAFGGPEAMAAAHRLFYADSRAILAYLRDDPGGRHRREISLMLCSIMLRTARQDIYEQGDVWARVAAHRTLPPGRGPDMPTMPDRVRRLITADAESQMRGGAPLAHCTQWAAAYTAVGRDLAALATTGRLHRGLRDVLAHHVIFAWNRIGLPYPVQAILAAAAETAVFGPDPVLTQTG
jgi:thiopeptide-type bacteriocin biosynthesis protein